MSAELRALDEKFSRRLDHLVSLVETFPSLASRQARLVAGSSTGHPAWRTCLDCGRPTRPVISFVVPVFNYGRFLGETLESVREAGSHLPRDGWEVLVVDDASEDHSLENAIRWVRETNVPTRVLAHETNAGVAAARNTAMEQAGGDWVFLLDADNLVLPHGPAKLLEAARPEDVAAYGILATFEEALGDGGDLRSFYPWDPEAVIRAPQVDAMALYRRSFVLECGGFDSAMRFEAVGGWEDYDLWLRIVQRSAPVAFLPDFVGCYRFHADSMISRTNEERVLLPVHLRRKYGELAERYGIDGAAFGE